MQNPPNKQEQQKREEEKSSTSTPKPNITKLEISNDNNNAENKQEIEINNNQQSEQSENEQIDKEESIRTIPKNIKFLPSQQPQQFLSQIHLINKNSKNNHLLLNQNLISRMLSNFIQICKIINTNLVLNSSINIRRAKKY